MKRFDEITDKALIAMNVNEIEKLVALECAYEGIPNVPEQPEKPEKPYAYDTQPIYTISGIHLSNKSDAIRLMEVIAELDLVKVDYNWNLGSDNKYFEGIAPTDYQYPKMEIVNAMPKNTYNELEYKLKEYKAQLDKYEEEFAAYSDVKNKREAMYNKIYTRINKVLSHRNKVEDFKIKFNNYLELAEGNHAVALKFLTNAYPEVQDLPEVLMYATPVKEASN